VSHRQLSLLLHLLPLHSCPIFMLQLVTAVLTRPAPLPSSTHTLYTHEISSTAAASPRLVLCARTVK